MLSFPLAPERGQRLLQQALQAVWMRSLGDLPGHEFHGNQYTNGGGLGLDKNGYDSNGNPGPAIARRGGALWRYRGGGIDAQDYLRDGVLPRDMDAQDRKDVINLDKAMRPLGQSITVIRDIGGEQYLQPVGTTFEEKGYTSTARGRGTFAKGTTVEIEVPAHAPAIRLGDYYRDDVEKEIILGRGSKFEVIGPNKWRWVGSKTQLKTAGDVYGHEFHGNQWTDTGGGRSDAEKDLLKKARVITSVGGTGFILRDGTRVSHESRHHKITAGGQDKLDTLLKEGVVRVVPEGVEVHQVPTQKQAQLIVDDWTEMNAQDGHDAFYIDVGRGERRVASKVFYFSHNPPTSSGLRAFVKNALDGKLLVSRTLGDVYGHEFHGNQWTGGKGERWRKGDNSDEGRVLNGVPLTAVEHPDFSQSIKHDLEEPPLVVPKGKHVSAGIVVTEPDGSMWVIEPHNRYGGYRSTFPKGTVDKGEDLQQTAARELWEESGLVAKVTGHLIDVERTTSVARFYTGVRVGGAPWAAGKETHAVKLIPLKGAEHTLKNVFGKFTSDHKVLDALNMKPRAAGDYEGHPFHGNQWTGGWPGGLQKIGEAAGSNPGGLYKDEHGQKWYVKHYSKPEQAAGEHVANAVYRAVGVRTPHSALSEDGRYASKWEADAGKTLAHTGLTKENADAVLDGFAADVFLSNWDAVGTGFDNVLVKGGQVTRIDQGGTLLHRAQGAPKPEAALHQIGEWKTLADPGMNSYYARIFKTAGLKNGDALGARAVKQIDKIVAARPNGGWKAFVAHVAPSMGKEYAAKVGGILEERQALLEKKRDELKLKTLAWEEEKHPRVPAGSGDASGEFTSGGGTGSTTPKAKKAPKAPPVPIETKKLAYDDVKAGGTFKAVAAKHGMTQGQLAGYVWKVDQAKKKINEALEEAQAIGSVVKAKDVLPQDVLKPSTPAEPKQIWTKMTADEKLAAVLGEGYVWKEKANSKSGNHAWFDKNGVQVSGYGSKDQYRTHLDTINHGEGLAQFKAPEVTAESTGHWPIPNTIERRMSEGYEKSVTQAFKPWVGKLTEDEKDHIGSYSGSGYSTLNEQLRNGSPLSPYAAAMSKSIHSALDKAPKPPPPELVWRGLSSPAASKLFAHLSPGDQFDMKGVQSTSLKPSFAKNWAHGNLLFEIKPAKGAYIKSLSSHKHEYEYILPHNAKYTVRGVSYIKMEGISDKTKVLQIEMHP